MFIPDKFGDLLNELGLIDLVRQLIYHDGLMPGALVLLNHHPGSDFKDASALFIRLLDPLGPVNNASGGKIRTGDILHQLLPGNPGIIDDGFDAARHLGLNGDMLDAKAVM